MKKTSWKSASDYPWKTIQAILKWIARHPDQVVMWAERVIDWLS